MDRPKKALTIKFLIAGLTFRWLMMGILTLVQGVEGAFVLNGVSVLAWMLALVSAAVYMWPSAHSKTAWLASGTLVTAAVATLTVFASTAIRSSEYSTQVHITHYLSPALQWATIGFCAAWTALILPDSLPFRRFLYRTPGRKHSAY